MTRYGKQKSYGHTIRFIAHDHYRLGWTVDRYYANSRLRFPTRFNRDSGETQAKRFAAKWGCNMPERR